MSVISGANWSSLQRGLPILTRLAEPRELLKAAILTRMGIGVLRIEENLPLAGRKPNMSREQKYASLFERIFVECFGVALHVLSIYGLQEPVSKLLERSKFLKPPDETVLKEITDPEVRQTVSRAFQRVYAPNKHGIPHGIVANQLYDQSKMVQKVARVKEFVGKSLGKGFTPEVRDIVTKHLMSYQRKLWVGSVATLGAGILASAYLSGYVLQWLNDNPVSKVAIPAILRKMKIAPNVHIPEAYIAGPLPIDEDHRTFRI